MSNTQPKSELKVINKPLFQLFEKPDGTKLVVFDEDREEVAKMLICIADNILNLDGNLVCFSERLTEKPQEG